MVTSNLDNHCNEPETPLTPCIPKRFGLPPDVLRKIQDPEISKDEHLQYRFMADILNSTPYVEDRKYNIGDKCYVYQMNSDSNSYSQWFPNGVVDVGFCFTRQCRTTEYN